MATKAQIHMQMPAEDYEYIKFTCPSMTSSVNDDNEIIFRMRMKRLDVHWDAIEQILVNAGIERGLAMVYVQDFAKTVRVKELAMSLAKHVEQVE